MPNRLAFHDVAYSLPSVLKSSDVNEKMHIVANVSFGRPVNDDVSNMSYDDHIEQAAIKFNLPHGYYMTEIRQCSAQFPFDGPFTAAL